MLAIITASLMTSGRADLAIARQRARAADLEARADAAINLAILAMLSPDAAAQPPTDGRVFTLGFAGRPVLVSVQDETGKVDLNTADGALLQSLLTVAGLEPAPARALAARILEWRTPGGVDAAAYRAAGAAYGPRRAPFPSVAELRLVLGMDAALFARLAPSLTVVSGIPWIDPSYAGRDVLLALPGASVAAVDLALAARAPPGVAVGHAFTVTAEAAQDGVAMIRRAVIRLTGARDVPVWIYSWERVTGP